MRRGFRKRAHDGKPEVMGRTDLAAFALLPAAALLAAEAQIRRSAAK
jgi:hypothetical protein